jgi:hypothetical protein
LNIGSQIVTGNICAEAMCHVFIPVATVMDKEHGYRTVLQALEDFKNDSEL